MRSILSLFVVILIGVAGIASPVFAQSQKNVSVFEAGTVKLSLPDIAGKKWNSVRDCKTAKTHYSFCAQIASIPATVGVVEVAKGASAESQAFLSGQAVFLKYKDDPGLALVSRQLMVKTGAEDLHVWIHDFSLETGKYSWAIGCANRRCVHFYFSVAAPMSSELVRSLFAGVTIGKDTDKGVPR